MGGKASRQVGRQVNRQAGSRVYVTKDDYGTNAATPIVYANKPVYVNVSFLPCPPGFMLTTQAPFRCDCNSLLQQMYGIKCHI